MDLIARLEGGKVQLISKAGSKMQVVHESDHGLNQHQLHEFFQNLSKGKLNEKILAALGIAQSTPEEDQEAVSALLSANGVENSVHQPAGHPSFISE